MVDPTAEFPELKATSVFQDMYPLLVLSEEGMAEVEREARGRVGQQGIGEVWKEERVAIQRWEGVFFFPPCSLRWESFFQLPLLYVPVPSNIKVALIMGDI